MLGQAGKGDKRRPCQIPYTEYARKFDDAFGKRKNWWETKEHQEWVKEAEADKENVLRSISEQDESCQ